MAKKTIFITFAIVLLAVSIFSMKLVFNKKEPDIVLAKIEKLSEINNQETTPLRIALGTGISPQSNIEYHWDLIKLIETKTGRKVEVVQKHSYADINYLLSLDLIDIAFVCSSSYVLANEQAKVVDLIAIPKIYGEFEYQSYIIVRADSGINKLDDLKDKVFAFSDPVSTTGFFYPSYRLKELATSPDRFFSDFFFTHSHDKSIYAVINGLADGAAVDSTVYTRITREYPDLNQKLLIIEKSPKFLNSPIVARSSLDNNLKNSIINILTGIEEDPETIKIFNRYGIDGFAKEPPFGKNYEPVKEIIDKVRKQ